MQPDARASLEDICDAGEIIKQFTAGLTEGQYVDDVGFQSIVERPFIVIDEAMVRPRNKHPTVYELIADGSLVIDFRNLLVHAYDFVDDLHVWLIVQRHLQPLLDEVRQVLQSNP